jgi:hypothetical protein
MTEDFIPPAAGVAGRRHADAVDGILIEAECATKDAHAHMRAGNRAEAANHAGRVVGLSRAGNVLSRVLAEVAGTEVNQ